MTANPFTPEIVGWAQKAQGVYQIPASLILSAAMVESSLGAHTPAGTNNWFGIKDSHGVVSPTREENASGQSYYIDAGFRVFSTPADGFMYYARLLGLGDPYHDMVTTFLKSSRSPADVRTLSNALTGVYATARTYGSALINAQIQYNLYQYDQEEKKMVDQKISPTATASTPPRVTPTASQDIRIDWGSWVSQLLAHEAPVIEAAAGAGVGLALKALPIGPIIEMFIGPQVVQQYVDMGLKALEGIVDAKSIDVPASNTLAATVANLINSNEAALAGFLGDKLDPMIKAAVGKLLPPATPAAK